MVKRGGWKRGGGPQNAHDLSDYDKELLNSKPYRSDCEIDPRIMTFDNLNRELSCPLCHKILQRTKITKDCMHRFCANCIVPLLREGQKACPVCQQDFAKNGPLRDDLNYDGIIEAIRQNQPTTPKKRNFADAFKKELHPVPKPKLRSDEFPALRAELNESEIRTPPKLKSEKVVDATDMYVPLPIAGNAPMFVTPPMAKPTAVKEFSVDINQVSRDPKTSKLSIGEAPLREILSHLRNVKLPPKHQYEIEIIEPTDPTVRKVVVRALVRPPAQSISEVEAAVEPVKAPPKRARYNDDLIGYHKRLMNSTMNTELVLWPDHSHFSDPYVPVQLKRARYIITSGEAKISQMAEFLYIRAKVETGGNIDFTDKIVIDFCTVHDERPASTFRFLESERGPVVSCEQICGPHRTKSMIVCTLEPFKPVNPELAISEVLSSNVSPFNLKRPCRLVFRVTRKD